MKQYSFGKNCIIFVNRNCIYIWSWYIRKTLQFLMMEIDILQCISYCIFLQKSFHQNLIINSLHFGQISWDWMHNNNKKSNIWSYFVSHLIISFLSTYWKKQLILYNKIQSFPLRFQIKSNENKLFLQYA